VCAYANNQWELGADISTDPKASSFFKAMQLTEGVLLVLDPAGTPFTRIWCCFEESMCMLETDADGARRLKLDIATMLSGKPCLIAEDLPGIEASKHFPLQLLERGFAINITKGEATQAEDKRRILNCIAKKPGCELDTTEPPQRHFMFDQVNKQLHSMFAQAAMETAFRAYRATGLAICSALDKDREYSKLKLNFCNSAIGDSRSTMQVVKEHTGGYLQHLALNFSWCKQLSDVSSVGQSLASLSALQHLALNFSGCRQLPGEVQYFFYQMSKFLQALHQP